MTASSPQGSVRGGVLAALLALLGCSATAAEPATNIVSRLEKTSQEHHAAIAKEAPKLAKAWQDAVELQDRIKQASGVFGIEARRTAERELPRLQSELVSAKARFNPELTVYKESLAKRSSAMRDELQRKRDRGGENPSEADLKDLADSSAKVDALDAMVRTLNEMANLVARGLSNVPTTTSLLGIEHKDSQLATKYSSVVEARKRVKDVEVDLEALRKDAANPGNAQRIAALEPLLAKTRAALEAEVAKASKTQTGELAKLAKKLEACDKKIADLEKSKRKVPDRLHADRGEIQSAVFALEREIATIAKMAGTKPEAPAAK